MGKYTDRYIAIGAAVAAGFSAWFAWDALGVATVQTRQSAMIAAIQSRVDSCAVLARHHYEITDQRAVADVFANTSRALTLCLVSVDSAKEGNFDNISACIQSVNKDGKYNLLDLDASYGDGVAC